MTPCRLTYRYLEFQMKSLKQFSMVSGGVAFTLGSNSPQTDRHETPVLVVGAGPAGLIGALQLSKQGIPCILVERNLDTTKWPKMDVTNSRSMEIFNRLGISKGIREVGECQTREDLDSFLWQYRLTRIGVPPHYSWDVIFSSGLSEGEEIHRWVRTIIWSSFNASKAERRLEITLCE